MDSEHSISIMTSGHIHRTIRRMAMQIAEDLRKETSVLLVGINTRGFSTAHLLHQALLQTGITDAGLLQLDIHNRRFSRPEDASRVASSTNIILVDDVLFSGTTMLHALRFILDHVEPVQLKVAVLVDRGHRKFPLQPDYVGLVSPTKLREHVTVQFNQEGNPDEVRLLLSGS